ncbi:hypothetical protein BJ875DRAFT_127697 [Amylocarpus encephaloides]|uniref:Rad4 beta-hairpin domain-containing protein n=1 Tax=Amylocarpus encephaloides TaxID=45428 RepID=A0A9P8C280_9HELO|nr:hypothetical protein BJ875DRAFT_127697 [Amylocarpus encephaloides]
MPPKRQRQRQSTKLQNDLGNNDGSVAGPSRARVSGQQHIGKARGKGKGKGTRDARNAVPDIYQEMLAEAIPEQAEMPERPLKKRKIGSRGVHQRADGSRQSVEEDPSDDEDIQFEDVLDLGGEPDGPSKRLQTAFRDSDEDSDDDEPEGQGFDFGDFPQEEENNNANLELSFSTKASPSRTKSIARKRTVTKSEKAKRIELHRMHILCLLSHVNRRNEWCNDLEVQRSLKRLLDKKVLADLRPKVELSQFGKTEFLKRGLDKAGRMWKAKFTVTSKGLQRALWAEDEEDLQNYKLPDNAEILSEKAGFQATAKAFNGSRDLAAQLYCALLRSTGLDVRLVCSLQPLSFTAGGPTMPRSFVPKPNQLNPEISEANIQIRPSVMDGASSLSFGQHAASISGTFSSPRRRLGHPNAADYYPPDLSMPQQTAPKLGPRVIVESPYPVFWVEVLDEAHQKWLPVDPLVTESIAKPRLFEPPMADQENNMSYVIAFDDGGNARDVTRRYTKAYNAKTRKNRIESVPKGDKWWRKTMRAYSRNWVSDLDQIEDIELAAIEAREPMPKNITDFKDHPVYALERHLRRNELLVATQEIGKVAAGRDSSLAGGKKLESVYRRQDVKVARSADAWYRLGRDIKIGEQPIKTIPPKQRLDADELEEEDCPGTNLYTEDQTDVYKPPPVVNGRVPKNSFGNIDVYVPTMVPQGGIHLPYEDSARAARLLGIDYAEALTGFEFKGRHGTAVLRGVVVATEYHEAVEAVIAGFGDDRAREQEQQRQVAVLNMWKRFLVGLRIKERINAYASDGEREADNVTTSDNTSVSDGEYVDFDDDEAGGFFPE